MDVKIDVRIIACYKLTILVLGCAHWFGCIYYLTAAYASTTITGDGDGWLQVLEREAGMSFFKGESHPMWDLYLVSS